MDSIEKFANSVYSIFVAILLRLKDFLKLGRSNPFFGTISPQMVHSTGEPLQAEAHLDGSSWKVLSYSLWAIASGWPQAKQNLK